MKISTENLSELFRLLTPAILDIDSGCGTCINYFIDDCNKVFKKEGYDIHLVYDEDNEDDPLKIREKESI